MSEVKCLVGRLKFQAGLCDKLTAANTQPKVKDRLKAKAGVYRSIAVDLERAIADDEERGKEPNHE